MATQSVSAASIPRFTAAANPMLRPRRNTFAPARSANSAESSVEPLSTTMISSNRRVCAARLSKRLSNRSRRFHVGITAVGMLHQNNRWGSIYDGLMKQFLVAAAVLAISISAAGAGLDDVKTVYVLPMSNGLDRSE